MSVLNQATAFLKLIKPTKFPKGITSSKHILLISGILLGVIMTISVIYIGKNDLNSKQYVYVNVEALIERINQVLEESKYNNDEISKKLVSAIQVFDQELTQYSDRKNAIIFTSIKPIAGACDKTIYFRDKIIESIK